MEKIDEKCQIFLSKIFEPSFFISDYETGFIAAVKKLMPQVDHLGCYFHYTQAVLRKIRNFGLIIAYRNNRPFQLLCRKIFSLGILPIDHVITYFDKFITIWFMPKTENFLPKNLVNYVEKNLDPKNWSFYVERL